MRGHALGIIDLDLGTKENLMKTMLFTGALLLALSISGCTLSPTPAATQGPPGPQGQAGATGQTGQSGQQGDTGQSGQQGAAGQTGDDGHKGETGREGREGREGQDAPCPAGQHRHTNPDTGKVICVRD